MGVKNPLSRDNAVIIFDDRLPHAEIENNINLKEINNMTNNKHVLSWIEEMAALVNPTEIVWIDGSEEQAEALRAEACSTGELIKLNQDLLPGCYLHRTAVNDVARVEGRTFICTSKKEDAGSINNWMDPKECYETLNKLYKNSYAGKKM